MTVRYIKNPQQFREVANEEQCNRMDALADRIFNMVRNTGVSRRDSVEKFFEEHYLKFIFRTTSCDGDRECESTRVLAKRYDNADYKHELAVAYIPHCVLNIADQQKPTKTATSKAGDKMKKVATAAKEVGGNMVDGNKQALGMATQLQAGRASNKVIKEAVRPLVKLMFKPSFMQRLLAKVFRTENPIDKFLDSPYGSLFAAQVAQAVVSAKGVENEKVKQVIVGGMAYSYNELGDQLIPIDSAIDKVVSTLTETADKLVK